MAEPERTVERRIPRDAAVVMNILRDMGVTEWEPRVVNQLMEFIHRYAGEVLEESRVYAEHAGRDSIALDDVKLAVAAKLETQFVDPVGVEELRAHAAAVNARPLPPLTNRPGIHVPQDENLLGDNYQFFPRGYEMGEGGRRGDEGDDDDDDVDAGAGGGGGGGGAAKPPAEPTTMEAHENVGFKVAAKGGGKKR